MSEQADEKPRPFRRLPRAFSLKRKSLIRPLFDRRRDDVSTRTNGCVRIVYRVVPGKALPTPVPIQVGFAPGRIAHATRRNRIKRLLREVYRVHQDDLVGLFSDRDDALTMMIIYRGEGGAAAGERIRSDLPPLLEELHRTLGETSMSAERRE